MKRILTVLGILIVIAAVAYFGITCWAATRKPTAGPQPPSAKYELIIKSTSQRIFADEVIPVNPWAKEGERIFKLPSYYQITGSKFILMNNPIMIDEKYFGIVEVKKR